MVKKKNSTRRWAVLSVFLLVLIVGAFVWWRKSVASSVQTAEVIQAPAVEAVYGIGSVVAVRDFSVKAGISTGLVERYIVEGQKVKRNDPLVRLTDGGLVRAPFDGTVVASNFEVGETVFQGSVIVQVVDPKDVYLRVALDQRAAVRVKNGQETRVSFEGLRDTTYKGRVRSVYGSQSRFIVRIDLPDLPPNILPGMTADVGIVIAELPEALMVPLSALDKGEVTVLRNGKKTREKVDIGPVDGERVVIRGGQVKVGETVILTRK